jgi:hypothetical protein
LKSHGSSKGTESQSQSRGGALWFTRDTISKVFALGGRAICHAVHCEKEHFLTEVVEELVEEEEFQKPVAEQGLCIQHGQLAVETWKHSCQRNQLSLRLKSQISERAADLREFIRKRDYKYRNETPGREWDSLLRAMRFFVNPNPCGVAGAKQRS